ncbi:MAG: xanthine dehydrogenase family protein molybdopterin-binding subunit [Bacillota bacterium]|jgi:CO/xanthine dehydrogenase Mo-binding subunit
MSTIAVGHSVPRVEGVGKVTGQVKFPADYYVPGMLYGKTLRSAIPSGYVKNIDISKAEALPGVWKVVTAKDVLGHNGHGVLFPRTPILVSSRIRSVNDAIALVVAESETVAEEALGLIQVEYEELPGVFDPREAMKDSAPKVWEEGNILYHLPIRKGNVDHGFAEADVIVENSYSTQMVDHAFLQPEAAFCTLDERGNLVVRVATQYVQWDRVEIARALGLNLNQVRVVCTAIGGAFGAREDMTIQIHCALLTWLTKRPVKMVYDRRESFHAHSKRHPMYMEYKTGAKKNGRLTAVEATIIGDSGAYASWSPNVLRKAAIHATGPYEVPHVKIDAFAVYTNNPFTGAMRGFGAAQPPVAHEAQMDLLAEKLNLHPFTIRWRNLFQVGSITATGQVLGSSVGLKECLVAAAGAYGWKARELL